VDHEATRQFVDDELALQQERDSERWGFDFVLERARSSGQGSKRYVWEVTPQEKIPELYAPRGMEYLGRCAVHSDDAPTPAAATAVASAETTNTKQTSISGTASIFLLYFDKSSLLVSIKPYKPCGNCFLRFIIEEL
jgi:hypothetical protein